MAEQQMESRHQFFKRQSEELGMFDKDSDYGGLIGEWVLELSELLAKQGHSGGSVAITVGLFNQLMKKWSQGDVVDDLVDRLPKTADDVVVTPGPMEMWGINSKSGAVFLWCSNIIAVSGGAILAKPGGIYQRADQFYSTRTAAEAAKERDDA